MTSEEKVQRGYDARRLLDDPILVEALAIVEADALEAAVSAEPEDDATRRDQMHRVRVIRDLRDALKSVITTGSQAARKSL